MSHLQQRLQLFITVEIPNSGREVQLWADHPWGESSHGKRSDCPYFPSGFLFGMASPVLAISGKPLQLSLTGYCKSSSEDALLSGSPSLLVSFARCARSLETGHTAITSFRPHVTHGRQSSGGRQDDFYVLNSKFFSNN